MEKDTTYRHSIKDKVLGELQFADDQILCRFERQLT